MSATVKKPGQAGLKRVDRHVARVAGAPRCIGAPPAQVSMVGRARKAADLQNRSALRSLFDGLDTHAYSKSDMTATVKSKTLLPDAVRRRAGLKPGDQVEFKVSRGTVTILTRRLAAHDLDDTLTAEEAKKVRHAMKQVREGKVAAWSKVKHELGV
jgi:bifunctional DNA-binding transcriptional regulator/antitoxin component of YhaV-PrlF toxin-antitoxin module